MCISLHLVHIFRGIRRRGVAGERHKRDGWNGVNFVTIDVFFLCRLSAFFNRLKWGYNLLCVVYFGCWIEGCGCVALRHVI
jgi:hypothetical protein